MITSHANPQIKNVTALKKKARERNAQSLFIVEGIKMALEAPEEEVTQVFVSESFVKGSVYEKAQSQLARYADRTQVVADSVFALISDTQTPQGILCLVRQARYTTADLLHTQPLILVLENLQDPGNLGTLFRTGEGAGVTGVLLSPGCVDLYNPKVIRSTMGSVFRVPFVYAPGEDAFRETLLSWKNEGISLFAAHLKGENTYDQEDYLAGSAFLIGNESKGLTQSTAALADRLIRIPMLGRVESLNAAMAGGILLYEAARQRRQI